MSFRIITALVFLFPPLVLFGCGGSQEGSNKETLQEMIHLRKGLAKSVELQQPPTEWLPMLHRYSSLVFELASGLGYQEQAGLDLDRLKSDMRRRNFNCGQYGFSETEIRFFFNNCQLSGYPICSEISLLNLRYQKEILDSMGCQF